MVSVMTSTVSCKGQAIWEMGLGMETNTQTRGKREAIPGN